jgi:transcriptional regulator GlxA family with amidase domain
MAPPGASADLKWAVLHLHREATKAPELAAPRTPRRHLGRGRLTGWVQTSVSAQPELDEPGNRAKWYSDRVLKRALEYLDLHHDQPVFLLELCRMVGVSAWALELLFRRNLGVSPMRYLKLRRLYQVRARLRCADQGQADVKSVALEAGFWDLGRFAEEYCVLFRESPAATLNTPDRGFAPGMPSG